MSYILDALKRAAEERQRSDKHESAPFNPATVDPAKPRYRLILAVPAMVLIIALLGWASLLLYQSPRQSTTEPDLPAANPAPPPPPATTGLVPPPALVTGQEQTHQNANVADLQPESSPSPGMDTVATQIPLLTELPLAIQAVIPEIRFNGHVYSDEPGRRMIMANERIVREHDVVAPETVLEEITITGVVLSCRNTKFRIELLPPP